MPRPPLLGRARQWAASRRSRSTGLPRRGLPPPRRRPDGPIAGPVLRPADAGLVAGYAGMDDGKLCIVAIWDACEHAEAFMAEQLGPGLRRLFREAPATRPRTLGIDVQHTHVR